MKLPDFSTFKPLNENRKQMNADLPDNLSFVTIDSRLDNADLERQHAPKRVIETPAKPAPEQAPPAPAESAPVAEPHTAGAARSVTPKGRVSYTQMVVKTPVTQIMLIVQILVLLDIGIMTGIFWYFGAPWQRHPMVVQNFITQVGEPKKYVSKQAVKPGQKPKEAPLKPFYKRNEYWDKNGVRHTVIEMLPSEPAPPAAQAPQKK